MKKLFQQFFYVPKHDAVPERVFLARTTLSLVSILACLVMLCATTLAWFYDTGTSAVAPIRAAQFGVSVTHGDAAVPVDDDGVSTFTCTDYAAGSTYTFTLTATGNAAQGYCVIHVTDTAGNDVTAKTTVLFPDAATGMTLHVTVQQGATITFTPYWGTPTAGEGGTQTAALTSEGERLYGDGDTIYVSESAFVSLPPPTNDVPSDTDTDTDTDTDEPDDPATPDVPGVPATPDADTTPDAGTDTPAAPTTPDAGTNTNTGTDTDTPADPNTGTDTDKDTPAAPDTGADTSAPVDPAAAPIVPADGAESAEG